MANLRNSIIFARNLQSGKMILEVIVCSVIFVIIAYTSFDLLTNSKLALKNSEKSNLGSSIRSNIQAIVIDASRHLINEQKCDGSEWVDEDDENYALSRIIRMGKIGHHSSLVLPDWSLMIEEYAAWSSYSEEYEALLTRCKSYTESVNSDSKYVNYCFLLALDNGDSLKLLKKNKITSQSVINTSRQRYGIVEIGLQFVDIVENTKTSCGAAYHSPLGGIRVFYGIHWEITMASQEIGIAIYSDKGNFYASKIP